MNLSSGVTMVFFPKGYASLTGAITQASFISVSARIFQKLLVTVGALEALISTAIFFCPFSRIRSISAPLEVLKKEGRQFGHSLQIFSITNPSQELP